MTEHHVRLGAEVFAIRLGLDGVPIVWTAPGRPKWTVKRLGPRTFEFSRVCRGRLESYVDSLPMPVAPPPVMPFLTRRAAQKAKAS